MGSFCNTRPTLTYWSFCKKNLQQIFAKKKNASATELGFVFGIYQFTCFLASPFFGKIVNKVGPKLFLTIGAFINSISTTLFGFLDLIEDRWIFISSSIFLRILEGLGTTAATVSSFTLVGTAFPDIAGTIYGVLETCFGAGFIIGPALGGILFGIGGFRLPFMCNGLMCGAVAIVIVLLPDLTKSPKISEKGPQLLQVLKVPSILIDTACSMVFALGTGFYAATLALYLEEFNLVPAVMSLMFMINGGTFTVLSPFAGRLTDKYENTKTLLVIACFLMIASLVIMAPLPCLLTFRSLIFPGFALFLNGMGLAIGCVAMIIDSLKSVKDAGFPDGVGTNALVNGLWTCGFSLGGCTGPIVGGFLYDLIGFRYAALCMTIPLFILIFTILIFNFVDKVQRTGRGKITSRKEKPKEKGKGKGEAGFEMFDSKSRTISQASTLMTENV